jgi:lipid-binding SYLF domain-containing protein
MTGGSFGLQIGVEKTDVVLFFMSEKGARSLVESEFTLGGQGSVAAGPVGRTAEAGTDIKLDAEIYSYARSKGLFAGLSLEGARINTDEDSIEDFYGRSVDPKEILFQHQVPSSPAAIQEFMKVLP